MWQLPWEAAESGIWLSLYSSIIGEIKRCGGEPFIVSAMGSPEDGGGTEEGQREILTGYGITEEAMGVPVVTSLDAVEIGKLKKRHEGIF